MSEAVSQGRLLKTRSRLAILFSAALFGFGFNAGMVETAAAADAPVNIGVVQIVDHEALNDTVRGIVDGMAERGWKDGEKAHFDLQNAHGDQSTLKNR
ncbi:ABC transporter substrate binding protein [uncultured Sutterella sp.]|uniref:ABC transporter substrate binding protein n=1 Tax=uncultured Sutterella sp. TaxID=286133 RepID=UPI00259B3C1A|nr:ABC transporter substrate binding protein [uncultured Sutterella sp.]